MAPPGFEENLGLLQGVEDVPVQEFIAQPCVEALDVSVLPGRAGLDEGGPGSHLRDPSPDGVRDELRAVVGADVGRDAAQDEQVGQHVDNIGRGELASHPVRHGPPGVSAL